VTAPLILTAAFDAETQAWLESLRRAHFPPERNFIPAHLTLFHALPGQEHETIVAAVAEACRGGVPTAATIGPSRFTGRGVALAVEAPGLAVLRRDLAARFAPHLTPQDRQGCRPHVTVQNKVEPEVARALQARLAAEITPRPARVTALQLWWYRAGPWEAAGEFEV
jgi:2'-5' RNA ligase